MAVTLTNEMIQGAINAQTYYNVPASVTLGQIMLESGGKNPGGLSSLAYNYNNLFGVKGSYNGNSVSLGTKEYSGGKMVNTTAKFRVYPTIQDSIIDHAQLLNKPIYTNKTQDANTVEEYVRAMSSTYATDPNYADKLLNIINKNNLTQYDNGSLPTGNLSSSSSTTTPTFFGGSSGGGGGGGLFSFGGGGAIHIDFLEMLGLPPWQVMMSNVIKVITLIGIGTVGAVLFANSFDINLKKTIQKRVGAKNGNN